MFGQERRFGYLCGTGPSAPLVSRSIKTSATASRDPPENWASPEPRLLEAEARGVIDRTISELPRAQAMVITMSDIEGFEPEEICNVLDITLTNQRVLLHRARARVRQALEDYMGETTTR